MLSRRIAASLFPALLGAATFAHAEVRLPHMLSDHAVLQREQPIHIWGWANPDEAVSVEFHGQKQSTRANSLGKWSIYLAPEKAGGPYSLAIHGTNTITLSDILVGDVWFASGQSNMEFPLLGFPGSAVLNNGSQEIAAANQPQIHLLRFEHNATIYEEADQSASWTQCTPETAAKFSAVAYFFGRDLQKNEHVPIGLVDSTWGGTPVSAWTSMDGLTSDAGFMPAFAARSRMVRDHADVPAMLAQESREDTAAKQSGKPAPTHSWHPQGDSWGPSMLFNGMVAPAIPYTIKGVIWYQGETDSAADRASLYENLFPGMITDWRTRWHQGNLPFLFVQISSFTSTPRESWGIVREAQRRSLRLTNTGMAVTIDVGQSDNVHPPDKQDVGARLALAARSIAYNEHLEFSGPLFRAANPENANMRIWFTHSGGLKAKSGALQGFEVAGEDRIFHPATTSVEGESVVAHSDEVMQPVYARYAWSNSSLDANLINSAGLPASTFTSEEAMPAPCNHACDH